MNVYRPHVASAGGGAASASRRFSARRPAVAEPVEPADSDDTRPHSVCGPFGEPLTLASLPSPHTRRWVVRRKAEVIAAIRGGLLSAAEACARYQLSPEELELWAESLDRAGVPGLRVTRIQLYRDYPPPSPAARPVGSPGYHGDHLSIDRLR